MKLYKYSLIAALALTGALSACSDDNDYTPAAPVSGDEVYLPLSQSSDISIPSEATTITLTANRLNTEDALSVPLSSAITDAEGTPVTDVFTVPSTVNFVEGSNVGDIVVDVDFAKVVPDEVYYMTLELSGDNLTPYGASKRTFALTYAPWTPFTPIEGEVAVYTMTVYTSGEFEVPVERRESAINPNLVEYTVSDLFFKDVNFTYSMDLSKTMNVDGVDCPIVTASSLVLGPNGDDEDNILILSEPAQWLVDVAGVTADRVDAVLAANNWTRSFFNPVTGTFHICEILYGTGQKPGSYYAAGYDYVQLPGYKSYVINFDYTGNFVDPKGTEYAVVNAFKSDDVASFVADIFIGALDESGVNAAIEDLKSNDDLESYTSSTNLAFICDEAGPYTVVGIGYDEGGNEVCKTAYTFNYETVKANSPWKSIGYCEYTDGIINSMFAIGGDTWDVEVEENTETPGVYRLVNPYKHFAELYDVYYPNGNYYMIVHAENPDQVYLDQTDLGIQLNQKGSIYAWSLADLRLQNGWPANAVAQAGNFGTLNDGVVTFPTGALLMTYSSLVEAGSWGFANVDPDNPAFSDEEVEYDPTWGNGTFCINFGSAKSAPAKHKVVSHKSSSFKEFDVKGIKVQRQSKANDFKTALKDYRIANPRQFKF